MVSLIQRLSSRDSRSTHIDGTTTVDSNFFDNMTRHTVSSTSHDGWIKSSDWWLGFRTLVVLLNEPITLLNTCERSTRFSPLFWWHLSSSLMQGNLKILGRQLRNPIWPTKHGKHSERGGNNKHEPWCYVSLSVRRDQARSGEPPFTEWRRGVATERCGSSWTVRSSEADKGCPEVVRAEWARTSRFHCSCSRRCHSAIWDGLLWSSCNSASAGTNKSWFSYSSTCSWSSAGIVPGTRSSGCGGILCKRPKLTRDLK